MRIAVIGAGIVGAATARSLARHGAEVTVFEQTRPGGGTSGTSFGWVNSHDKRPASYHRLNAEGCVEHRRLADAGVSIGWFFPTGNLRWADDAAARAALDEQVTRLAGLGYACRWLDPAEVRRLEPDLTPPLDVDEVAFFPEEGYALPRPLLARLLGEAMDRGAALRWPVRVTGIEDDNSAVWLRLADGSRQRYDRVVCCVGRWSEAFTAALGVPIPMADPGAAGGPAVGYLAYTTPIATRLSRVVTTPRLNLRPDGGGRLVLQGLDLDADADPSAPPATDAPVAETLLERLGTVLAGADLAEIALLRVGQRALPGDGLTVAGPLPHRQQVYVVATHSGVTLGPLLGRLVAEELVAERESELLTDFRPDRFGNVADHDGERQPAGRAPDSAQQVTVAPARRPGVQ